MSALVLAAAKGYEPPSTENFWQPLIGSGAWAITRPMVLMVISVVLLAVVLLGVSRRLSVVPGRAQFATEGVYDAVRNGLGRDIIGDHDFLKFLPLLFTLFTLILVNNVFSIIPVIQYPTMSRIGFPAGLALVVYIVFHAIGIRSKGLVGYFTSLAPPGLPKPLLLLIYPLELITYFFTRPVTLALRLFGNMFAGHILLLLFITGFDYMLRTSDSWVLHVLSIGPFVGTFVMTAFELLVQVLQAYIFTLLAALYIAGALADEH
ncbi:ATP synthase F0 subcomplex A subunit [Motilibacter rhizosphaerae]|uniref:ATP synthase subunit a n=1 Tax=Motilibacter rhizosphaerae TaxID=598652 RepID=A0A4Q7NQ40_9ACTN|nr:F0F1 ATP synthase subunit A [Motilibacter rhizosphaerae]RZS87106.1 ATP synthase F0 subcomplex A subunit [Motilibacter rhizosphaerae]